MPIGFVIARRASTKSASWSQSEIFIAEFLRIFPVGRS
jgi:hypothetical protein